jgi:hypothetical protein
MHGASHINIYIYIYIYIYIIVVIIYSAYTICVHCFSSVLFTSKISVSFMKLFCDDFLKLQNVVGLTKSVRDVRETLFHNV